MRRIIKTFWLAARICMLTGLTFGAGWFFYFLLAGDVYEIWTTIPATVCATIGSLPAGIILLFSLPRIGNSPAVFQQKRIHLVGICAGCSALYGTAASLLFSPQVIFDLGGPPFITNLMVFTGMLFSCSLIAIFFTNDHLRRYFSSTEISLINKTKDMETTRINEPVWENDRPNRSNRILYKGIATGVLILAMMIPMAFITNLVGERQQRQKEVATEVSSRWAGNQTLTGPYIYLPYKSTYTDQNNKPKEQTLYLLMIPDNLNLTGRIDHELRSRSIYKVLLYRTTLQDDGNFVLQLPKEVSTDKVLWNDAMICYGLSDFRGIEEKLVIRFNDTPYELSPGLPANDINEKGLSAPIPLSVSDLGKSLPFQLHLKIKGSETLHFLPLSGNSHFTLSSAWPNPSFDGSNLPVERTVSDSGFTASWGFNKANLPFGTVLKDFKFDQSAISFGVTMVQPADEYAKTNRSVKYAILIIGLTFSIFFIVELRQKKPIHPIQYVLIGLALVIFYSLLLAISEFLLFDLAYLIAAGATIILVSVYARSHFQSWKSAGIFAAVLTLLYGFIFVLIRLEDTALLIGSIGLFIILAISMYASRKINWYGGNPASSVLQQKQ